MFTYPLHLLAAGLHRPPRPWRAFAGWLLRRLAGLAPLP